MIDDKGLLGWEIAVEDGYGQTNPGVLRDWIRRLIAEVRAQRETIAKLDAVAKLAALYVAPRKPGVSKGIVPGELREALAALEGGR